MKKTTLFSSLTLLFLISYTIPVTAQNIPDFLVNEQGSIDGAQQTTPYIDGDGNGNYVLTWKDKRNGTDFDIFAQIYNNGIPIGDNFKVNDDVGTAKQYDPAVAVDPNLNFVIVWVDKRNGNPNTDWDLYAQRYSSDGIALGNNFKVNDEQETHEKSYPSISLDSFGNFVIVWTDKRNYPSDIYGQRFLNDGTAQGNNFRINDDVGNYWQFWSTCSFDNNGKLIVSWVDRRYDEDRQIYAQYYSADGTTLGNNFQVNSGNTGTNNLYPDITIDGNNNFIIVWEDNRNGWPDIYAQRYLSDGSTLGENFKINEDLPDIAQCQPSISSDFDGNFTVCWEDNRNDYNDVYARRYSNDGTALGGDFKVSTDVTYNAKQENSVIATDLEGNFIICWEDHRFGYNGEIFAQSYLNDGTPIDENFIVNDDIASENQQWPSIAIDGNENFIIAWADNRFIGNGIYAQRFSSEGTAIEDNFKINDDTGDNWTLHPSVAANTDGSFIVTWSDTRSGDLPLIYAQRFANDASPLGSNFQVNYLSAAINYKPEVICKPNGDFIICWGDLPEDSKDNNFSQNMPSNSTSKKLMGEPDIWIQQFMSDGTPIGENLKVNDDGGFTAQMNPDIAMDADGNFIITWEDDRNEYLEVYLQRYLSDGTPVGENFTVEEAVYSDWQLDASVDFDPDGNFTVAWRDGRNGQSDIFCRQFDNDGIPVDVSFQVNSDTGISYQSHPRISIQENGRFIVTWTDDQNGTYDVYAQRYESNAQPYSDNFLIPNTNLMDQSYQDVVLANNRIYTSWHDNKSGQTGYDIWANVLDWDVGVGIDEDLFPKVTSGFYLHQNSPNPMNTSTTIQFSIPHTAQVVLKIFDICGNEVATLTNETLQPGKYKYLFNGTDLSGGVYFYKMEAVSQTVAYYFTDTRKFILLK